MVAGGNQKFEKLDVKRVYFGNWLRDYSQAIDVGGLKQLPAETIRVLLWCLSFLTFGFATGEFEVTAERLGCYRPEEHIDNPKVRKLISELYSRRGANQICRTTLITRMHDNMTSVYVDLSMSSRNLLSTPRLV